MAPASAVCGELGLPSLERASMESETVCIMFDADKLHESVLNVDVSSTCKYTPACVEESSVRRPCTTCSLRMSTSAKCNFEM